MNGLLHVSSSPHARSKVTTDKIMFAVLLALAPAACVGVWNFGLRALLLIVISMAVCPLTEYLYEKGMKKPVTIADGSALVTGLLLAMNMPVQAPLWMPVIGGVFAILVVKQLFGGLGQNFMNPALGARCFLLISFAGKMTTFTYDGVTTATPLAILKSGGTVDVLDMFIGRIAGTIGETSAICLLIGGLYLIIRKVISPIIPLVYIGTFSVFIFLYSLASGMGFEPLYLAAHLCGGGLMLGAFFMATDYVTSPITKKGKVVFGIILGLLTFLFRIYGGSAEGVSYAIIISNLLVPLIERFTQPKSFGKGAELQKEEGGSAADSKKMDKKSIVIATVAILVITLVAGGVLAYVQQITKKPIEQAEQQAKEDAYREVFTDADAFRTVDGFDSETASTWLSDKGYKADIDDAVTACDKDGNALGYVFVITSHEAYGGDLQLALGVAEDGTTNGISFLSLSETAGLGMQADTDEFKSQFAGKNVAQFKYTKSGAASDEEIDALSGATITTNAVTNAVNAGLSYADYLKGGAN